MNNERQKVIDYYEKPESRWGYSLFLWDTKHFAYYPEDQKNISERQAQSLYHDLLATKLTLTENDLVLDAGCGRGVVAADLSTRYGASIIGIDIVPFELEIANRRAEKENLTNVLFTKMDYSQLEFDDDVFDAIYTTETLSHSPNITRTLSEFHRVLRPGGRFAFFEYTIAPDEEFTNEEKKMLDIIIEGSAMIGLKEFRHNNFPDLLSSIGFENVTEENISENMRQSLYRLYRFARIPYKAVQLLHIQQKFVNMTAGYECYKMADKDLLRYCIFTGKKSDGEVELI
jgi:sterol 24-C-methyltransferase